MTWAVKFIKFKRVMIQWLRTAEKTHTAYSPGAVLLYSYSSLYNVETQLPMDCPQCSLQFLADHIPSADAAHSNDAILQTDSVCVMDHRLFCSRNYSTKILYLVVVAVFLAAIKRSSLHSWSSPLLQTAGGIRSAAALRVGRRGARFPQSKHCGPDACNK